MLESVLYTKRKISIIEAGLAPVLAAGHGIIRKTESAFIFARKGWEMSKE
jgi:hypothetical protein